MSKFEILCVTMNQNDFSKIKEMNIHADVVFANQCDHTSYNEVEFEGHKAKMISTQTRGVGINRNLASMYSSADICLLADDDVVYDNNLEQIVLREFNMHPDADIFVFHLDTDSERKQVQYKQTKKCGMFTRQPWGAVRIAYKRSSVIKANICFSSLFGGGCIFPSGEDSMWLLDAKRKGLVFYVSKETIGRVSFAKSTWFTGFDENYYFGKGANCYAMHPWSFALWRLYYLWRCRKLGKLSLKEKNRWIKYGKLGYQQMLGYSDFQDNVVTTNSKKNR